MAAPENDVPVGGIRRVKGVSGRTASIMMYYRW